MRTGHVRVALHRYPAGERQPRHAHDATTVSLVVAGAVREQVGSRTEVATSLSVVVKPAGTEHANEYGTAGATLLQIALRQQPLADAGDWRQALPNWEWTHAGPSVPAFLRLLSCVRHADRVPEAMVDAAFLDVIAALRPMKLPKPSAAPHWLALVREELEDLGPDRVHVWALAARAGVHPVHLARQFRRAFGCSVSGYIQQRRVQRAAALMAGGRSTLAAISHEIGFADQSHLCRTFRRATGMSPSGFQALLEPES